LGECSNAPSILCVIGSANAFGQTLLESCHTGSENAH
jgi:hypothetical protein